jgi:hypothetical protein
MRENRQYGSEGGVGVSRSRPLLRGKIPDSLRQGVGFRERKHLTP